MIITFRNEKYGSLRAITINNETYFFVCDLHKMFGITGNVSNIIKRLNPDEHIFEAVASGRRIHMINSKGFYNMINRSTRPWANEILIWFEQEVVPQVNIHNLDNFKIKNSN